MFNGEGQCIEHRRYRCKKNVVSCFLKPHKLYEALTFLVHFFGQISYSKHILIGKVHFHGVFAVECFADVPENKFIAARQFREPYVSQHVAGNGHQLFLQRLPHAVRFVILGDNSMAFIGKQWLSFLHSQQPIRKCPAVVGIKHSCE